MSGFCKTYSLITENHTKLLAESLAKIAQKGDIFLLKGDLGTGKTTFARFFIRSLMDESEQVPSPTFNIVQTYEGLNFDIWHFDLYRLESSRELEEIGLEDSFYGGVSLIEWPERLGNYAPKKYISLLFEGDGGKKTLTMTVVGDWKERIHHVKEI